MKLDVFSVNAGNRIMSSKIWHILFLTSQATILFDSLKIYETAKYHLLSNYQHCFTSKN